MNDKVSKFLESMCVRVNNQTENDIVLKQLSEWSGSKINKQLLPGEEGYLYDKDFPYIHYSFNELDAYVDKQGKVFKFTDLHKINEILKNLNYKEFVNADDTVIRVQIVEGQVVLNKTIKIDVSVLEDIAHFVSRK